MKNKKPFNRVVWVLYLCLFTSLYTLGQEPDRTLSKEQLENKKKSEQDFMNRYGMTRKEFIKKHKPVNGSDYAAFEAARNAEFVFEGIVLTESIQDPDSICFLVSHKVYITKVLRGNLKPGTVEVQYKNCITSHSTGNIRVTDNKIIFFCDSSKDRDTAKEGVSDHKKYLLTHNNGPFVGMFFDSSEGNHAFIYHKYFSTHNSAYRFLKRFKNLNFDAEEKKYVVPEINNQRREDTINSYKKQQEQREAYDKQQALADDFMLSRIKNMQISDTISFNPD